MDHFEEEKILLFLKDLAESEIFQQIIAGASNLAEAGKEVEKRGYAFGLEEFREIMLKTFYFISCRNTQKSIFADIPSGKCKDEIFEMLEYSAEFGVPVKTISPKVFRCLSGD